MRDAGSQPAADVEPERSPRTSAAHHDSVAFALATLAPTAVPARGQAQTEGGAHTASSRSSGERLINLRSLKFTIDAERNDAVLEPRDWGTTRSAYFNPEEFTYAVNDKTGAVDVDATLTLQLRWAVSKPSQTNIAGPWDRAVTRDTWRQIVADLTPNEFGYAPRKTYWAEDLVIQHELFHVADIAENARLFYPRSGRILTETTIVSMGRHERGIINTALKRLCIDLGDLDGRREAEAETLAYKAGKPFYVARVAAIEAQAASSGWGILPFAGRGRSD